MENNQTPKQECDNNCQTCPMQNRIYCALKFSKDAYMLAKENNAILRDNNVKIDAICQQLLNTSCCMDSGNAEVLNPQAQEVKVEDA